METEMGIAEETKNQYLASEGATTRRELMVEWRILCAVVVGIAGFLLGFEASDSIYVSINPNVTSTVFVPLSAPVALAFGIVTWKCRRRFFSYVTLLATAGIAGAALGLMLITLVMLVLD